MAQEQDDKNYEVTQGAFVKSDDKQNIADGGTAEMAGIDYAESLPGGGSDSAAESSLTTDEKVGFDHHLNDDERS